MALAREDIRIVPVVSKAKSRIPSTFDRQDGFEESVWALSNPWPRLASEQPRKFGLKDWVLLWF